MTTRIGRINRTPTLRRPLPIADGFALRGQNGTNPPPWRPRIPPRIIVIAHRRDVGRQFNGWSVTLHPPATRQIPIAL
jgi:hypothetical protein